VTSATLAPLVGRDRQVSLALTAGMASQELMAPTVSLAFKVRRASAARPVIAARTARTVTQGTPAIPAFPAKMVCLGRGELTDLTDLQATPVPPAKPVTQVFPIAMVKTEPRVLRAAWARKAVMVGWATLAMITPKPAPGVLLGTRV